MNRFTSPSFFWYLFRVLGAIYLIEESKLYRKNGKMLETNGVLASRSKTSFLPSGQGDCLNVITLSRARLLSRMAKTTSKHHRHDIYDSVCAQTLLFTATLCDSTLILDTAFNCLRTEAFISSCRTYGQEQSAARSNMHQNNLS